MGFLTGDRVGTSGPQCRSWWLEEEEWKRRRPSLTPAERKRASLFAPDGQAQGTDGVPDPGGEGAVLMEGVVG